MKAWKIVVPALLVVCAPIMTQAEEPELDELFYYLGTTIVDNLESLGLSDAEKQQVGKGVTDALDGTAEQFDETVFGPAIRSLGARRMAALAEREITSSDAYLTEMAAETGAIKTSSGLIYQELQAGSGAQPTRDSTIRAHYHGTLRDGTVFDSSVDRGEPLTIGLGQVIPCWTEGIALMRVGGKAKLTCPSGIAYGERGQGQIAPNAALTFEVELLDIIG